MWSDRGHAQQEVSMSHGKGASAWISGVGVSAFSPTAGLSDHLTSKQVTLCSL